MSFFIICKSLSHRLSVSATKVTKQKMTATRVARYLQRLGAPGLMPLLKPLATLAAKGMNPVIFSLSGDSDCPEHNAGLSYFKDFQIMKNLENTPKIYVGTYGRYNDGSLFGKWFDLSDYCDNEEFYKDCYEYHRNEFFSDGCRPELMFQDWEYIPEFLISECSLHEDTFKYFELTGEMDRERKEAFEIYCSSIVSWPSNGNDLEETLHEFEESYQGYFSGTIKDPELGFTYQYIEDTGMLSDVPELSKIF